MSARKPSPAQRAHYRGALSWTDKRGATTTILSGWAACGNGRRFSRMVLATTLDASAVTCKLCQRYMALGGVVVAPAGREAARRGTEGGQP